MLMLAALPAAAAGAERSTYIVELRAEPLAAYRGDLPRLPATSPAVTGRKVNTGAPAARRYESFLEGRRQRAIGRLGRDPRVLYRYRTLLAGFAATLTKDEALVLRRAPEVFAVTKDRKRKWARATPLEDPVAALGQEPPNMLGLPRGIWSRLGGPSHAGEDVIVGVIDSGIHPEHPSFADRPVENGRRRFWGPAYPPPAGFRGTCQTGERFPARSCNNKLIGARYFVEAWGEENVFKRDFLSPRDADGHGSHTAATAAGNFGVDPIIFGNDLGVNLISGLAPRAYLSHYKALWIEDFDGEREPEAGYGQEADIVAASDQAAADGVDVINASLGVDLDHGGTDPLSRSFLRAMRAGVFVAVAAGNSGPGAETIGAPADAPWVMGVGASTVDRTFKSQARLRDSSGAPPRPLTVSGRSLTAALAETPLIDAVDAAAAGADPEEAEHCVPGTLRRSAVRGKAVLCRRGISFIAEKSREVHRVGGRGALIYNGTPERDHDSPDGIERHWVPTVELESSEGAAVKRFIAAAGSPVVRLTAARATSQEGDKVTDFSSRGPLVSVPDLVKPDVVAPGAQILAAFSPFQGDGFYPGGDTFHAWQGTSMASPHGAGAGALLADLHPSWSPMRIKSALVTTARRVTDHFGNGDPFTAGGGRIDPNRAAQPGLVLEETPNRFERYLEGIDPEGTPGDRAPVAPSDLNLPSIGIEELLGTTSVNRRFTSVEPGTTRWSLRFSGLASIRASASPAAFTLASGATRTVRFSFTRDGAAAGEWAFGSATLTGGARTVRLPVAVRPELASFPEQIDIDAGGASGSRAVTLRTGYSGFLSGLGHGLAPPDTAEGETIQTTTGSPSLEPDAGSRHYPVTVPDGARAMAGEISNVDGGDPSSDLDLYLYYDDEDDGFDDEDLLTDSVTLAPTESITVPAPEPGRYLWVVVGFTTQEPSSVYDFSTWVLADPSPDDPSNPPGLVVSGDPVRVSPGGTARLSLDWSGVNQPGRYLGVASWHDSAAPGDANEFGESLVWLERGN